jgi:hypothetical protein
MRSGETPDQAPMMVLIRVSKAKLVEHIGTVKSRRYLAAVGATSSVRAVIHSFDESQLRAAAPEFRGHQFRGHNT